MPEIWSALAGDEILIELELHFSDAGGPCRQLPRPGWGRAHEGHYLGSLSSHCVSFQQLL